MLKINPTSGGQAGTFGILHLKILAGLLADVKQISALPLLIRPRADASKRGRLCNRTRGAY